MNTLRTRSGHLPFRPQRGLGLVEILVAMTIGLMLLAGVGHIFINNHRSARMVTALARVQENGRFALQYLAYELRQAGDFQGCTPDSTVANTVIGGSGNWLLTLDQPLRGYDDYPNNTDPFPGFTRVPGTGTDALVLARGGGNACVVDSHVPASATIHCRDNHRFKQGKVLAICDIAQQHIAIVQQSNTNNNDNISVLVHNTGNSVAPGNCTHLIGSPVPSPCDDSTQPQDGTSHQLTPGSRVFEFSARAFFVTHRDDGVPALYAERLNPDGENIMDGTLRSASELVEGVEDLQILYGIDTDTPPDRSVDAYVPVTSVTDWGQVMSVRVSVLVQTLEDNLARASQVYYYDRDGDGTAEAHTATDRRLRQVFNATITLRNATL
jgi:type IV pilus assembly protein PilW